MNILASVRILVLVWFVAGYAGAASADVDEGGQSLAAARQAAKGLLEPVGDAFGCEFTKLRLARMPGVDGYVAFANCTGERCAEALDVLNRRGESRALSFVFERPSRVAEDPDPDWEPWVGEFDLIHEINPDVDQ